MSEKLGEKKGLAALLRRAGLAAAVGCACAGAARAGDAAATLQRRVDANPGGLVRIAAGTYEMSRPLVVTNNCSLEFEKGAVLKAVAKMDYLVRFVQRGQGRETGAHITGGVLDGNGRASCLLVTNFYHPTLRDISFHNGYPYGLHVESPGCEVVAENLYFRTYLRGLAGNTAMFIRGGDSHFIDCIAVDYTVGVYNKGGANRYSRAHVWSGPVPPAKPGELPEMMKNSICFIDEGTGTLWRDCYADSGEIGFLLRGANHILDGCNYFNNIYFGLDHVTAIAQPARGSNALISHMTFNKTARDFKVYRGVGKVVWRDCIYNGFEPDEEKPGDAFAGAAAKAAPAPRIANVVNFVRGAEPRDPSIDLVKPLAEEIALNTRYGLPNTILMQYDAMLRDDLMKTALSADRAKTEYGVWIEIVRQLTDKVGLAWRSTHPGWTWDWHVTPGFLMAYSPAEREKLVDEIFRLFREKFGAYPASVGSWLLDAHSMDYMQRKYGVAAFCICREQDDTDAYGLRGGYFNGAYYPSKRNALSAARGWADAIRAPVFRMLTPNPISNYGGIRRAPKGMSEGCPTMEPVWYGGFRKDCVDWYLRTYAEPVAPLALSYMQVGQENSFGWPAISRGLPYQIERIAALRAAGKLTVETLGDSGRRFQRAYVENCPQAQVALVDETGSTDRQSVWYNCRNYRANLMRENGRLFFRDVHAMKDGYAEPYLEKPCTGWQAIYDTPPVVDEYLFRTNGATGTAVFSGTYGELSVTEASGGDALIVTAKRDDGAVTKVIFSDNLIKIFGGDLDFTCPESFAKDFALAGNRLRMKWNGFPYEIAVKGRFQLKRNGWTASAKPLLSSEGLAALAARREETIRIEFGGL